ncbi:MAG: glycosyltransferase family 2 protein [Chloroflexi bacterium]|nr:glycosyltransferase family 2 protein [Chloroflexota bacterium]
MKIGVVILNWHQADDVITCVQSVKKWSLPAIVWVVDNASTDDSIDQIQQTCPIVHLIANKANLGFAGGNNVGIQAAVATECDAVMLLNNDAVVDETAVSRLITTLNQHPNLGIVGPSLWDADQPDRLLSAGGGDIGKQLSTHLKIAPADGQIQEVGYIPGTCILIRTDLLNQIGLLDEAYFFGGEVADLCVRARQQGFASAIVGGAKSYHQVERSASERHNLHIYYVLRNRFLFVSKFHPQQKWRWFMYWTWQCALTWVHALRMREWRRARAVALACWDGWNGHFGAQNSRVTKGAIQ